jgi:hypothetical protein
MPRLWQWCVLGLLSFHRVNSKPNAVGTDGGLLRHARRAQHGLTSGWQTPNKTADTLNVFQVYKPVDAGPLKPCDTQMVLMEHSFANSYGHPFVGNYTPPSCDFTNVEIAFNARARGRQFDRLASMYLGDIEVWRLSTAEPTPTGIVFKYTKDMTSYLPLWRGPQTIIFDLGNLINDVYTSPFNTTLIARFWNEHNSPPTADMILPISAQLGSQGLPSAFNTANTNASVLQTLPSNTERVVVSISACGQIDEEQWWSNVLSEDTKTFQNTAGTLPGYSPFREVQLYIDGILAGVVWPFPIIFTGGVAPGLWKPIVGIDAYDLREPEIDVTPFAPLLTDGNAHRFSIQIVGFNGPTNRTSHSTSSVGSYWVVSGKIFVYKADSHSELFEDHSPPRTTISAISITTASSKTQAPSTNGTLTNQTLTFSLSASRNLRIHHPEAGLWSQSLTFSNQGFFKDAGLTQRNIQSTKGTSYSSAFEQTTHFSYPLDCTTTTSYPNFPVTSPLLIDANITRGLYITSEVESDSPVSLFSLVSGPMVLGTVQSGGAKYSSVSNASYNFGHTEQKFRQNSGGTMYERFVKANNLTILRDESSDRVGNRELNSQQ